MLCEYGCGKEANYYFKTVKKWCCSERVQKCKSISKKIPGGHNKKRIPSKEEILNKFLNSFRKKFKNLESIKKSEELYNVKLDKKCWLWLKYKDRDNYGISSDENNKPIQAHRLSYKLFIGEIPKEKIVAHYCDTPDCVNPNHLFLASHAENIRDRKLKGRSAFGLKNGMHTKPETRSYKNQKACSLWKVTYPDGKEEIIKNLTKLCRDNNISYDKVKNNRYGWKVKLIQRFVERTKL